MITVKNRRAAMSSEDAHKFVDELEVSCGGFEFWIRRELIIGLTDPDGVDEAIKKLRRKQRWSTARDIFLVIVLLVVVALLILNG